MFDSKKLVKVVSVAVASMSLLGVSASVSEARSEEHTSELQSPT